MIVHLTWANRHITENTDTVMRTCGTSSRTLFHADTVLGKILFGHRFEMTTHLVQAQMLRRGPESGSRYNTVN
jgi:hypothetical protein